MLHLPDPTPVLLEKDEPTPRERGDGELLPADDGELSAVAGEDAVAAQPPSPDQAPENLASIPRASTPSRPPVSLSRYIEALEDAEQPPNEQLFDEFWQGLLLMVRRELRRRCLWESPPRYLGVDATRWTPEAISELSTDIYAFILERLRALTQQLRVKGNVDGLILLNVRHFLHDRQKQNDPLGFRLFEVLRQAVRQGLSRGHLLALAGSTKVSNNTVLVASGHGHAEPAKDDLGAALDRESLEHAAAAWSDELLPELIVARGARRDQVVDTLSDHVRVLLRDGQAPFKGLADALKAAVRRRWLAVWEQERGEVASGEEDPEHRSLVPVIHPALGYEDRQSYQRLVSRVSRAVEHEPGSPSFRAHLSTLWRFLSASAPDPGCSALPSRRRVAELLGVPRYLLPQLYGRLAEMVEESQRATRCRAARREEEA